jgi:hypothetical protein
VCESGSIISYRGLGSLAKPDQLVASTVKAVAMRIELKTRKNAADLDEMIRVFWTNQKVEVHEARSSRHIVPYLDVREDELNVGKATCNMLPKHLFVRVGHIIIGNSNGLNLRRDTFQRGEVSSPSANAPELVIQNGSGCVNVRFPAPPLRTSIDHGPSLCSSHVCVVLASTGR